jgi:hypothetical protein
MSFLMKKKLFDMVLVFCPTIFNNAYDWIDGRYLHTEFKKEPINTLLGIQEKNRKKHEKDLTKMKRACIIFDDMLMDDTVNLFADKLIQKLAAGCRHYYITIFWTCQHLGKIPPVIKSNCSLAYIFKAMSEIVSRIICSADIKYKRFWEFDKSIHRRLFVLIS